MSWYVLQKAVKGEKNALEYPLAYIPQPCKKILIPAAEQPAAPGGVSRCALQNNGFAKQDVPAENKIVKYRERTID